MARLLESQAELATMTEAAIAGVLHVDDVLDRMLEFASLEIEEHPDFDYEDDDTIAYKLAGTPEGTQARLLVGLKPYYEGESTFRYLQLAVDVSGPSEYVDGVFRESPHIDLSISYDVDDPLEPTRFAMILQRRVDLAASRDAGLHAYHGVHDSGALYGIPNVRESPHESVSRTIGIVDGQPGGDFPGISPLGGDTDLDLERLRAILAQLHEHLSTIKGD